MKANSITIPHKKEPSNVNKNIIKRKENLPNDKIIAAIRRLGAKTPDKIHPLRKRKDTQNNNSFDKIKNIRSSSFINFKKEIYPGKLNSISNNKLSSLKKVNSCQMKLTSEINNKNRYKILKKNASEFYSKNPKFLLKESFFIFNTEKYNSNLKEKNDKLSSAQKITKAKNLNENNNGKNSETLKIIKLGNKIKSLYKKRNNGGKKKLEINESSGSLNSTFKINDRKYFSSNYHTGNLQDVHSCKNINASKLLNNKSKFQLNKKIINSNSNRKLTKTLINDKSCHSTRNIKNPISYNNQYQKNSYNKSKNNTINSCNISNNNLNKNKKIIIQKNDKENRTNKLLKFIKDTKEYLFNNFKISPKKLEKNNKCIFVKNINKNKNAKINSISLHKQYNSERKSSINSNTNSNSNSNSYTNSNTSSHVSSNASNRRSENKIKCQKNNKKCHLVSLTEKNLNNKAKSKYNDNSEVFCDNEIFKIITTATVDSIYEYEAEKKLKENLNINSILNNERENENIENRFTERTFSKETFSFRPTNNDSQDLSDFN